MSEIFANIPTIPYEGPKSTNPLAFKFYDADRAFSLAESAATASSTLLARTIFSKSNIRSAPFR